MTTGEDGELIRVLAGAVECRPDECAPARCFCRAQANAIAKHYRLTPKSAGRSLNARFWSDEKKARLETLFHEGHTYGEIARRMSLSIWQVKGQLEVMKLRRRDWGPGKPRPSPAIIQQALAAPGIR